MQSALAGGFRVLAILEPRALPFAKGAFERLLVISGSFSCSWCVRAVVEPDHAAIVASDPKALRLDLIRPVGLPTPDSVHLRHERWRSACSRPVEPVRDPALPEHAGSASFRFLGVLARSGGAVMLAKRPEYHVGAGRTSLAGSQFLMSATMSAPVATVGVEPPPRPIRGERPAYAARSVEQTQGVLRPVRGEVSPGSFCPKGERRPSSVQASQARLPQGQSPILSGTAARPDIAASRETTDGEACWTGSTPKPFARRLGSSPAPGSQAWARESRASCARTSRGAEGFQVDRSVREQRSTSAHQHGENTAEYMFYTLNTIRMCATAQRMFGPAVVKPFFRAERPRAQSGCGLETSEPLWAGAEIPSQSREDPRSPWGLTTNTVSLRSTGARRLGQVASGRRPKLVKSSSESRYSTRAGVRGG
ncbi:hypothetical protein Q5P01_000830 [Channa striata]|uniref:Uncharacterized protein n=1 Tax=Channa striata TaxID=64152 RepID=A0AA88LIR6_CHASR|nr:hypothetical protein Q5P01_000830 [Channa striata]